jgi:glutamate racemase
MFAVMDAPIGIFDSGYGGLTVMKEIVKKLPAYDYLYLGDNARAPYGPRSFDTVYRYTLECVKWFFSQHCPLVILACNTASAKALRTIQQNDLALIGEEKRVLGVIRPTTETIGEHTSSGHIGILATAGTVASGSYLLIHQQIRELVPPSVSVLGQGEIVAVKLADYLARHPEIEGKISRKQVRRFYTTDSTEDFDRHASQFYGEPLGSSHLAMH